MDINGTLALIAAISAIVAPAFVALINNHHQRKMKKLEMATEKRIEKIQNYINLIRVYVGDPTDYHYDSLVKASLEVSLYVSKDTINEIRKTNNMLKNDPQVFSTENLATLVKCLQKDLGLA